MAFCTSIKKAFKKEGHFYFKMPDSPSAKRFMIAKPFDSIACVNGTSVAIEAKALKGYQAFGMRHLRPNQVEGLEKHSQSKGISIVILEVHAGRGDYRCLFWEWKQFKYACLNGSIKKKDLEAKPFIQRDKNGLYDLDHLFDLIDYSTF